MMIGIDDDNRGNEPLADGMIEERIEAADC